MNIYAIRKAILRALKEYAGAPITVEELISLCPSAEIRLADKNNVRVQWAELKNFKYIEPIQGFGGEYCGISQKGLEQLSLEFTQDFFIHGPGAIR